MNVSPQSSSDSGVRVYLHRDSNGVVHAIDVGLPDSYSDRDSNLLPTILRDALLYVDEAGWRVKWLTLFSPYLTMDDKRDLLAFIERHESLRRLDICFDCPVGTEFLKEALSRNERLEAVWISSNVVGDDVLEHISTLHRPALRTFSAANTSYTRRGMCAIADFIKTKFRGDHLSLGGFSYEHSAEYLHASEVYRSVARQTWALLGASQLKKRMDARRFVRDVDGDHAIWSRVAGFLCDYP